MNFSNRISVIFSHPVGFILTWIVAFGILALAGNNFAHILDEIDSHKIRLVVIQGSQIIAVTIAILLIIGGYRVSHFAKFNSRYLKLALIPCILIFVCTMLGVRFIPSSLSLIMLNGLSLVLLSFLLGELLSREVSNPGHLIPVAIVLALVDFWSVFHGPSKQIASEASEFVAGGGLARYEPLPWSMFLLLRFPQPLVKEIYSFIGVGDLVILAFFVGCIHRFNLPKRISYIALILGPIIAVLIANLLGKGIPALPIIAILFIVVNIRHLPMEKKDMLVSIGVIVFLIILISVLKMIK